VKETGGKRELVVATTNKGKLREIRELFREDGLVITALSDYPGLPAVVEDGATFYANAVKKARQTAWRVGKLTLGEDSGLEVEFLNNAPGVCSARFAGPGADDARNNAKLRRALEGVRPEARRARYRCFAALAAPDGEIVAVVSGRCSGLITGAARGQNGFGYDPYFFIPRYAKTFGELDPAVKARISHRARAMRKIKKVIEEYFRAAR
jgi:XTP/dITP diphosphohydrolase